MARRIVSCTTLTPTAFADTTNMTNGAYPFMLQGGTATQLNKVWEISIAGQAPSSSSPTIMLLSRDSQVATGANSNGTGVTDAAIDPATAALAAPAFTGNINATALPQRSSTLHLANCSLNAFGGVYFWRANRLEECFSVLGNTASLGEVSLSAFTGGTPGLVGSHMIYESL
jgi:hypothetical protein